MFACLRLSGWVCFGFSCCGLVVVWDTDCWVFTVVGSLRLCLYVWVCVCCLVGLFCGFLWCVGLALVVVGWWLRLCRLGLVFYFGLFAGVSAHRFGC